MTINTLVEELRPTIEQHRDEADRLGRLPDQLVAQLREAGAFRLYLPHELGGAELSLRATLELLEGLGHPVEFPRDAEQAQPGATDLG